MSPTPNKGDLSRRRVLQGTALGAAAIPAAGLLSACATGGGGEGEDVKNSGDAKNPFDVDGSKPLDVVIFNGGFGVEYADEKTGHVSLYKKKFKKSDAKMTSQKNIKKTQMNRFADSKPADVIDNSGADKIALDTLVNDGLLAELTPLLKAPSIDDPDKTVEETLIGGALRQGTFNVDGKPKVFALPYITEGWFIWHNGALFKEKGWDVPKTWEEMLDLAKDMKKDGVAPWTFTGVHPYYLWDTLYTLAARDGGREVVQDIDNLKADAWGNASIEKAAEAMYKLQEKGYTLEGSPGLDHTKSQLKWYDGDAAFIPVGTWLPLELSNDLAKDNKKISDDFEFKATGVFAFEGSKSPDMLWLSGGEPFVVPEEAANKPGAYEYLRIMLSKEGSKVFTDATKSLSVLDGQKTDDPVASQVVALNKGPDNLHRPQVMDWYVDFKEPVEPLLTKMMKGDMKPDAFLKAAQKAADKVAANDKIDKFKQEY
ncbi:N-acetylglucosamine/diacetylchitobiose ABC transporter substrate-binding protein [Stackebrandtia nassauensis]|uniref:Extracellular solute-binding protein family 1 n=1 Tax=Stackebrandtia nassauensis (strain DSM 44728 / CIP 108903 / NRRL B-16338 / NBRC 102104 / LLR-40K-21) TaxID=446470 RepID=D3Q8F6_STANL|nr:N-acetylglucosamine/diacetylchitobiose ABC transporter substrate-binding protein [Stackebrandtia nassauensis]ADD42530.1 extracellular solute-binding protein family 1 [Stackebrandtia nassauensis DSM 44728]